MNQKTQKQHKTKKNPKTQILLSISPQIKQDILHQYKGQVSQLTEDYYRTLLGTKENQDQTEELIRQEMNQAQQNMAAEKLRIAQLQSALNIKEQQKEADKKAKMQKELLIMESLAQVEAYSDENPI